MLWLTGAHHYELKDFLILFSKATVAIVQNKKVLSQIKYYHNLTYDPTQQNLCSELFTYIFRNDSIIALFPFGVLIIHMFCLKAFLNQNGDLMMDV